MLSKERQEQVVELCQKLIRQQSYSGHEDGVVAELSAQMKAEGFDSVTVDRYGNIIGCIKGSRPGKKILFDGHIDTVPVGTRLSGPILRSRQRFTTAKSTAAGPAI